MRYILIALCLLITLPSLAQLKAETTLKQASLDMVSGITNELVFATDRGYCAMFQNTKEGVDHAFKKFFEINEGFNLNKCENWDLNSPLPEKLDSTLDFGSIAHKVGTFRSEVDRFCVGDGKIKGVRLLTVVDSGKVYWRVDINLESVSGSIRK